VSDNENPRAQKGGLFKSPKTGTWKYNYKENGENKHGDTGKENFYEAQKELRKIRGQKEPPKPGEEEEEIMTLEKALDGFARAHKTVRTDKYIQQMRDRIEKHFAEELLHPLESFTTRKMEEIRQRYLDEEWSGNKYQNKKKGHSIGGWNNLLRNFRALMNWARGKKLGLPFEMKESDYQSPVRPVIWPELCHEFLQQVDKWPTQDAKTVVRLMLYLGLREDEAIGARWEWFSARTKTYSAGDTKSREVRAIPIPEVLMQYVESHHKRKTVGLIMPIDEDGKVPHSEGFTTEIVRKSSNAISIPGMTPHRIRASFATGHYELGTPLNHIQRMMGHENQSTTEDYVVTRKLDLAESQEKLASVYSGSQSVRKKDTKPSQTRVKSTSKK
jgi:integrase